MSGDDSDGGGPGSAFEERLRAARERRGMDPVPARPAKASSGLSTSALGIGMRVGVELVSALVVAVAIGYGLDWLLGTKPIFIAVFVLLGGAAGVLNVWRIFAPRRH
jgi:ATP synthase protein I